MITVCHFDKLRFFNYGRTEVFVTLDDDKVIVRLEVGKGSVLVGQEVCFARSAFEKTFEIFLKVLFSASKFL